MYALVKIVTEGFVAYSKCIFIEVPAKTDSFCFNVLPYILGLLFIIWSIILFIKILKAERVENRKKYNIPIRLIEICASVFLSVNLIITVTATAYRTVNDFATGNSYSASREKMSEYVLNADLTQNKSEIIDELTLEGDTMRIQKSLPNFTAKAAQYQLELVWITTEDTPPLHTI